jgi:TetR/AcrR family transcriptional repressor of nem operon
MMQKTNKREETRTKLLRAAGRGFRKRGFGGAGIDAVAKEAGVTSGAVYEHYGSKARLFREALLDGLEQFRAGVASLRTEKKGPWLPAFAKWYMSADRRANLADSCALATLTLEAARADAETRTRYDTALRALVKEVAGGKSDVASERKAIAILAILAGGLAMGHAARDKHLGDQIASAVVEAVSKIA